MKENQKRTNDHTMKEKCQQAYCDTNELCEICDKHETSLLLGQNHGQQSKLNQSVGTSIFYSINELY